MIEKPNIGDLFITHAELTIFSGELNNSLAQKINSGQLCICVAIRSTTMIKVVSSNKVGYININPKNVTIISKYSDRYQYENNNQTA
jgi:hypothetical protein